MSLTRQPTLLRMVMDPSPPTTPSKATAPPTTDASPNRTELEPTPLLLALDMAAERKRLRSRKDSVLTGAGAVEEESNVRAQKEGKNDEEKLQVLCVEEGDGKEVIVPVKEDLSQLALLGMSVGNALWNSVETARKGVWSLAGWA